MLVNYTSARPLADRPEPARSRRGILSQAARPSWRRAAEAASSNAMVRRPRGERTLRAGREEAGPTMDARPPAARESGDGQRASPLSRRKAILSFEHR